MIARFNKAWAALAAGAAVVLASGLITGEPKVYLTTGLATVAAVLNVIRSKANTPNR